MQSSIANFYKFRVQENLPMGRGCIATRAIEDGEIICKLTGPTMNLKALLDKYDEDTWTNPLQIGEDIYLDLIEPYVCFNHSCEPNAGIRNNGVLFALKDIAENEEIFYDYSTTVDDLLWKMDCLCNSRGCRGQIGDFQSIPHTQKQIYLKKGALSHYITHLYY